MSGDAMDVQVRFCPAGKPTVDRLVSFAHRLPTIGEEIDGHIVVEVRWRRSRPDRYIPWLVAHEVGRPRAEACRTH